MEKINLMDSVERIISDDEFLLLQEVVKLVTTPKPMDVYTCKQITIGAYSSYTENQDYAPKYWLVGCHNDNPANTVIFVSQGSNYDNVSAIKISNAGYVKIPARNYQLTITNNTANSVVVNVIATNDPYVEYKP